MDRRDADHKWYDVFDEKRMTVTIDGIAEDGGDLVVPVHFEVCETCGGRGRHVNPSIDAHGLSREDFDEDPDFAESYWRGDYDIPCNECHGRNVVPVMNDDAPANVRNALNSYLDDRAAMYAEMAAERRMGV